MAFKTPRCELFRPFSRRGCVQRFLQHVSVAGFTLLEVMVCLSIISIVLIAVYRMHSQTLVMNQATRFYTTAPLLAQRRLAEIDLNTPSDFSNGSGDFGDEYAGYSWKISASDVEWSQPDAAPEDLKRIDITVSLNQDELSYNLRTYRYLPQ